MKVRAILKAYTLEASFFSEIASFLDFLESFIRAPSKCFRSSAKAFKFLREQTSLFKKRSVHFSEAAAFIWREIMIT